MPQAADRRRIVLTGATGFVGQAVLLALLEKTTDVDVLAVVRPSRGTSGFDRLKGLLTKPCFESFVATRGADAAAKEFDRRVSVLETDLAGMDAKPEIVQQLRDAAPLYSVIHCASAVSFDLPLDEAFETNVGGALGLYSALAAAGVDPHVVHVSTAYVGGSARGLRTEGPLTHNVDWETERRWAQKARQLAELESRSPEELRKHLRRAQLRHSKEGPKAMAAASEEYRQAAVEAKLQDNGFLRAQTLGWTDVYTFTKAMSERVAETRWAGAGHRLSVVRPSIIESSASWPFPGWIDGYKVADPLIMAYAKGQIRNFPALPDSILDVVPVDHVVGVIVAVALGHTDRRGADAYYQVVSGTSNPLMFHTMVNSLYEYFHANPLSDAKGRPIKVKPWSYSGGGFVEPTIIAQETAVKAAEWGATLVPRYSARKFAGNLHKQRHGLGLLRKFIDLYKHYTKTELVFDDSHTRALLHEVTTLKLASDLLDFDISRVQWRDYLNRHLPEVVALTGDYTAKKSAKKQREIEVAEKLPAPSSDTIALFDLDGTVASPTIISQHLQLLRDLRSPTGKARDIASLTWNAVGYIGTERRTRSQFLRDFCRRYAGVPLHDLEQVVAGDYAQWLRQAVRPQAQARIDAHRQAGHRTILITGTPEPLVAPLAGLFDEIIATPLESSNGILTGFLSAPPIVDEARAAWVLRYASDHGVDLAASYGYGDSQADVTWLALLGHPFAINPDLGLYAEAKRATWPILNW